MGVLSRLVGSAAVCLLSDHMTVIRQRIDMSIPRKRAGGISGHDKVRSRKQTLSTDLNIPKRAHRVSLYVDDSVSDRPWKSFSLRSMRLSSGTCHSRP